MWGIGKSPDCALTKKEAVKGGEKDPSFFKKKKAQDYHLFVLNLIFILSKELDD